MRLAALALSLCFVAVGCAHAPVPSVPRSPWVSSPDSALDASRLQLRRGLDRLQLIASWSDLQANRAHLKTRLMAVFSVMAASGAGAAAGVLAQPRLPEAARPGIGAIAISAAALSGVFTLAPPAHHYALKERAYRDRAALCRGLSRDLLTSCGARVIDDPLVAIDEVRRCIDAVEIATLTAVEPDGHGITFVPDERWLRRSMPDLPAGP